MTGRPALLALALAACNFATPGFGSEGTTNEGSTSGVTSSTTDTTNAGPTSGGPPTTTGTGDLTTTNPPTGSTNGSTGPGPSCGDGVVDAGENCDDGNADNTDECTTLCLSPICGDGFVHAGVEACDDGNGDDTDDCTSQCAAPACGDGFVHAATEVCDDGNSEDGDDCRGDCQALASCGDKDVNLKGDPKGGLLEDCEPKVDDDPLCTQTCKTLSRILMQAAQVARPILKATKPEDVNLNQECLKFDTLLGADYPLVLYNIVVDLPIVHPTVGHLAVFLTHVRGMETQTVLLMSRPGYTETGAFDSVAGGHDANLTAANRLNFRTDGLNKPGPAESVGEGVASLLCDKPGCQITPDAGSNADPYDPKALLGTLGGGQWYVCVIDPVGPDVMGNEVRKGTITLDLVKK